MIINHVGMPVRSLCVQSNDACRNVSSSMQPCLWTATHNHQPRGHACATTQLRPCGACRNVGYDGTLLVDRYIQRMTACVRVLTTISMRPYDACRNVGYDGTLLVGRYIQRLTARVHVLTTISVCPYDACRNVGYDGSLLVDRYLNQDSFKKSMGVHGNKE